MISFAFLLTFLLTFVKIISSFENKVLEGFIDSISTEQRAEHIVPSGTIVYTLDEFTMKSFRDLQDIRSAMEEIEKKTCVKWVQKQENFKYVDYVSITRDTWCWSLLIRNGSQGCKESLSLKLPFRQKKGIFLHELLHILGLQHEHQRADRNEYITVNWDNVIDGFESKFATFSPSPPHLNYDYKSVMHYTPDLYAKNTSIPVIKAKLCDVNPKDIGHGLQEGYLTQMDIDKIKMIFGCRGFFFGK